MTDFKHVDPMDPAFEIPAALDRRGEESDASHPTRPTRRQWKMPTQRRVAAMKRQREKENRAIRRAIEKDLRAAAPDDVVETAAALTRTIK